jgi:hypothetical protein
MYGNSATTPSAPPPMREQVSTIHAETVNLMESSIRSLDHLIAKTLGPRPEEATTSQMPGPPSLMNDARRIIILAHQVQARLEELHGSIGHEKQ